MTLHAIVMFIEARIAIASSPTWLNTPTMAIPAAIYSLIMYPTSAIFARFVRQRQIVAE